MKEFDYDLDYKSLDFTDEETRKLYRIGRGGIRSSTGSPLIQTTFVFIGDSELLDISEVQ